MLAILYQLIYVYQSHLEVIPLRKRGNCVCEGGGTISGAAANSYQSEY